MIAVATVAVLQYNIKALLVQTHFCLNNLERSLIGYQRDPDSLIDIGIDELARSPKLANLDKETIYNCSINALKNLHLLPGTLRHREDYERSTAPKLNRIVTSAEKFYDIIFIDTNAGNSQTSMDMLHAADLIVVNLSQNIFVIDKYFEDYNFDPDKTFYLIGDYEKDSKYNLFNLKSKYEFFNNKNIGVIPHCVFYKDAQSSENALRFIRSNIDCNKGPNAYFIKAIKEASEMILDKVKKGV